jgi:hypothetical protein
MITVALQAPLHQNRSDITIKVDLGTGDRFHDNATADAAN